MRKWLYSIAMVAISSMTSHAAVEVLFFDDFNVANGTSLFNPEGRATGTLAAVVKYAWTDTNDVIVDGTLNWDANGNKSNINEQPANNGTQSLRFGTSANSGHFNWFPYVGGMIWDLEYDILTGNSQPLGVGLADSPVNGAWNPHNNAAYDFGLSNWGVNLRYDTDNDAGTDQINVGSVFSSRTAVYKIRIRFNEPLGKATIYINGAQVAETNSLDFEADARYIAFGEPTNYAGYIDNLKISLPYGPNSRKLSLVGLSTTP